MNFLDFVFGSFPPDEPLLPYSYGAYVLRWKTICTRLGVPHSSAEGVTPGSLRGSGATWLYQVTENVPLVAWRGRWRRIQNLEYYLQEVAGQQFLLTLSDIARDRIALLNLHAEDLLHSYLRAAVPVVDYRRSAPVG